MQGRRARGNIGATMTNFVSTFYQLGIAAALDISGFTLDHGNCGILITSTAADDCRILYANANFIEMTGYPEHEIVGKNCRFLQKDDRNQAALIDLRRAIKDELPITVELRNYRKDGSLFWCGLSLAPFRNQHGQVTHFVGVQTNIDAQKKMQRTEALTCAAIEATHDDESLRRLLADMLPVNADGFILLLEIDAYLQTCLHFDGRGTEHLQQTLAQRLRACIAPSDFVVRHTGGSFSIVLRTVSLPALSHLVERIQQAVHTPIPIDSRILHLTCCIGIARHPTDGNTTDALLNAARLALRQARASSHNAVVFYSDDMLQSAQHHQALTTALHAAINNGELQVYYQPQVDLVSGAVIGVEALARWFHPVLGEIEPSCFIRLAEESDLINSIGDWILEQIGRDIVARRELGLMDVAVAVNLSPVQLCNLRLPDLIGKLISSANIEPQLLILEITEAALAENNANYQRNLQRLQEMGIGLALDDFGSQYSSLNHLKHVRFQKVKIDCALTRNVVDQVDDAAIVKAIISMAHTLGLTVVAEGVETEAQCRFMRDNMCNEIQGFLFSRPVSAAALSLLLRDGATLPAHLRERVGTRRTLLLVDDEINIVSALKRLLRRDDYLILTAHSGTEGLAVLKENAVDVILSDQRMPGMTGVEFLSIAKNDYPETIRLVLSGYTELQSVTDAVNEGAIYKFLTKPWDDTKLRGHVREAFERKELADVNQRLGRELYATNQKLANANRQLEELVCDKQQQLTRDNNSLQIVREALQHIPLAIIAIDDLEMIAFVNDAAAHLLRRRGALLGGDARELLPEITTLLQESSNTTIMHPISFEDGSYAMRKNAMGSQSRSSGFLITLTPITLAERVA